PAFLFRRRISASINPATITAIESPGATTPMPSAGAAIATRIARMTMSSPFGVLKNLRMSRILSRMAETWRFIAFELRRHDQPVHSQPIEELNAFEGTEHEGGRRDRIRQHRGRSD